MKLQAIGKCKNRRKCAELLGLYTNKVMEVVVTRGWWCAQTDCSVLKRNDLVILFPTSSVLVLCQGPAPRPKMVKGG